MTVPMSDGGASEFVQNGYLIGGPFYFSYRQFAALSNELSVPAVLYCRSDLNRVAAQDFGQFQNTNLSYFVGVNADFSQPDSIMAGDRNLTSNPNPHPTILRTTSGATFWWTRELHARKGNILFADGHVEEWNNHSLVQRFKYNPYQPNDLFMPTVGQGRSSLAINQVNHSPASGAYPGGGGSPNGGMASGSAGSYAGKSTPNSPTGPPTSGHSPNFGAVGSGSLGGAAPNPAVPGIGAQIAASPYAKSGATNVFTVPDLPAVTVGSVDVWATNILDAKPDPVFEVAWDWIWLLTLGVLVAMMCLFSFKNSHPSRRATSRINSRSAYRARA
ncbi:MAG TPA: hypothetical protein VF607_09205 [Verrucomicrobiae bacterium]